MSCFSLLSACVPKSTVYKPPLKVPEQFSSTGRLERPDKWWLLFNDPILNQLLEQALSQNFSLAGAWSRLLQKEALVKREGAGLWPTLDFQSDASRTETRGSGGTQTTGQRNRSFDRFFLGLNTRYEVDLWGRLAAGEDAAKYELKASKADLLSAAMTLSAQVSLTWFELVAQYGQVDLVQKQLETNKQVLDLVTFRFRHGKVSATDVLQQRQLIESRRGELVLEESKAKVKVHQLAILLGAPPDTLVFERMTHLVKLPPLPINGLPATLIQRRPDIKSAYFSLQAADRKKAAAVANRFPRLSLSAQVNSSSETVSALFNNWLMALGANVLGPILDGGRRRAEVARSDAVFSERLNDYGQRILEALAEVENGLIQERQQHLFIESLQKQLDLSEQVLRQTRDNYRQGAVDFLQILDVLLTQQALEKNLLKARLDAMRFRVDLYRALGGGWDLKPPLKKKLTMGSPTEGLGVSELE